MGYWDCRACGTKRVEGPERQCPGCGQPRSAEVQFYTDDDAPEVDDAELLKRARSGADWHCPYCGADNRAGATSCIGCGASTEGAEKRQQRLIHDVPPAPPPRAPAKSPLLKIVAAAFVLLALIGFGGWWLVLRTTELSVEVTSKAWKKTLVVERLETDRGEAWSDEVPSGARRVDSFGKKRTVEVQDGTQRVKVGKKDLGNGFFEDVYEDRPKYVKKQVTDTWVKYEIDRWKRHRTLEEKTTDGTEPPWPQLTAGPNERAGPKTSEIVLALQGSDGKSYAYEITADDAGRARAAKLVPGGTYTAEVNALGMIRDVRPE